MGLLPFFIFDLALPQPVIRPKSLCRDYVGLLSLFGATAQQDDEALVPLTERVTITWIPIGPEFQLQTRPQKW
jgi:hypothetical protein